MGEERKFKLGWLLPLRAYKARTYEIERELDLGYVCRAGNRGFLNSNDDVLSVQHSVNSGSYDDIRTLGGDGEDGASSRAMRLLQR